MVVPCVKNDILMDISGTTEKGEYDNSENLDIDLGRILTGYMATLNDGLHERILH